MAYEKIYQFPDRIKAEWMRIEKEIDKAETAAERTALHYEQNAYLQSLVIFYETICQTLKFKHQKQYTQAIIMSINPSFAKGYFKK
jgi:hypothetical protein